jgi:hypothetical protein
VPAWHDPTVSTDRIDGETTWIPRMERPALVPTVVAASAAAVLTGLLAGGAALASTHFAGVVTIVQLLLVVVWYLGVRTPGRVGVAAVAGCAALAASGFAAFAEDATVAPLAGVVAVAFGATTVAQLVRGAGRRQVTEAYGATMTLVVAVVALASTISLHRQSGGPGLLVTCLAAAGLGLVVARLTDLAVPGPNVHYAVPRGLIGIGVGSVVGALTALVVALLNDSVSAPLALIAGWGVALAGILADLGVGYASAGRALVGETAEPSPLRPLLGPLLALAVAAPAGYVFGLVLLS